ncbi:MAG TPA: molybdopterin dinucleotide binding domain-containing protein [Desulfatiglandales bacterium]|nr:molybdopterin dinucleotide binding domain-containing protein [Desulfatiglandales bacterium]
MAKNIDEVFTDCTLCYHSCGTRVAIEDGDGVIVQTDRGQVKMKANVDKRVAEGVVLVLHGWPGEVNANLLTDTQCREPIMGYPPDEIAFVWH